MLICRDYCEELVISLLKTEDSLYVINDVNSIHTTILWWSGFSLKSGKAMEHYDKKL